MASSAEEIHTTEAEVGETVAVAASPTGEGDEGHNNNNDPSSSRPLAILSGLRRVLVGMASPLTDESGSFKSILFGLPTIALVGTILGWIAPANEDLSPSYRRISASLGYTYFMAWSVSFYPQVLSNFKRKSTVGLSTDFCVLNVLGFGCYTAYNASFYWSPTIRKLYQETYGPDATITVQSNDVAFAIHALALSLLTLVQIPWYHHRRRRHYDGLEATGRNESSPLSLSKPILLVMAGIAAICVGYPLLVVWEQHFHKTGGDGDGVGRFNWLNFVYVLSYIKIFISLIKYIPQVLLNFRRKSTVGWSIWNILLDLTGGVLSDLQLVLDSADQHDFTGITHNKAKLALGSLSIVFDLVFLVQHYCLYANRSTTATEQSEPLLPPTEDTEGEATDAESQEPLPPGPRTIFV